MFELLLENILLVQSLKPPISRKLAVNPACRTFKNRSRHMYMQKTTCKDAAPVGRLHAYFEDGKPQKIS